MTDWSQSHFLQSLGWATLNSFWQMAFLWCLYLVVTFLFQPGSHKKYLLSVFSVILGFAWFIISFFFYYESSPAIGFLNQTITDSNSFLNIFLISASIAYLSLLSFPAFRFFKNWQFIHYIKKEGLQKAGLNDRLFVQKIAVHLGITKKVGVYISEIIKSPVTIGYLKPIILLPVAALNNLSTQQVEAVLLHELSHIKRYDYLINFIISIIHTILYFNPFVKQFIQTIETERENCCDQLVLQFGYDKVDYATALLTLEKLSAHTQVLTIAATGKNYLLQRIEKIIGMERKRAFRFRQWAGVIAALLCILAFNSILIIKEKNTTDYSFAYNTIANPFALFNNVTDEIAPSPALVFVQPVLPKQKLQRKTVTLSTTVDKQSKQVEPPLTLKTAGKEYMLASQNDVDAALTKDQKDQVNSTIDATKKVITNLQWKEVEAQIADAMTNREKVLAKQEVKKEVENINWKNIAQNLKAQYQNVDWNKINTNLSNALTIIELDSLQQNYNCILFQLEKTEKEISTASLSVCTPLPDASVAEIAKAKQALKVKLEIIQTIRANKKVVRL